MAAQSRDVRATFSVEDLGEDLILLEFSGEEAISSLFEFEVVLASTSNTLSFSQVVGKEARISIAGTSATRHIHGMVSSFQQRERARRYTVYLATVVPQVWRLNYRQDCRIFQNLSTEDIAAKVLQGAGIPADRFKIKLAYNQSTPSWDYCVQYRESDWNFLNRLFEEKGFFYFFEHSADKHVLIIANTFQYHPPIAGDEELPFHAPGPQLPANEHIYAFSYRESIRPGKVTLSDYNLLKPSLDLQSEDANGPDSDLEIYDFPGEYGVTEEGKGLANIRLQEQQVRRCMAEGGSDCVRLVAGYYFVLKYHSRADFNDEKYLITEVHHQGLKHGDLEAGALESRIQYSNEFQCIPRKVPFRAAQVTPKPTARGVQTAVVVGPAGEEIHTDKYGRVKVQFHWDRLGRQDDNSSCWVPVSQYWASKGWGAMYLPRIGDEVVVDFIEGDPDRPIVTGRVYHAQNVPPYKLPDEKTKSTIKSNSTPGGGGFNEIRFEDKKGSEEIFTHAQRNQNEVVRNNMSTYVGGNQSLAVHLDRAKVIEGNESTRVEKCRDELVLQDEYVEIRGDRDELVEGIEYLEVHGLRDNRITESDNLLVKGIYQKIVEGQTYYFLELDRNSYIKGHEITEIKGERYETVDGIEYIQVDNLRDLRTKEYSLLVEGSSQRVIEGNDRHFISGKRQAWIDGNEFVNAKGKVTIRSDTSIKLKVGPSSITIKASGISILGPMVKINC